ncbi:hypothetical protein C0215_19690, partial [Clostridioides difficile]
DIAGRNHRPSDMSAIRPGGLGDTAGHRSWARGTRESWSTPRALGDRPDSPGELVDPAGRRERARVPQDSWSTPQVLGPGSVYHGTSGRNRRPSDKSVIHPGGLIDPSGPCSWVRVTRDSWLTPRVFGTGAESRGTAGQLPGLS